LYPLPDGVTPIPAEVLLPPKLMLELRENTPDPPPPQIPAASQNHPANQIHPPTALPPHAAETPNNTGQAPKVPLELENQSTSKQSANQNEMENTPSQSIYDLPFQQSTTSRPIVIS